jgi:hypothetical protein
MFTATVALKKRPLGLMPMYAIIGDQIRGNSGLCSRLESAPLPVLVRSTVSKRVTGFHTTSSVSTFQGRIAQSYQDEASIHFVSFRHGSL